MSPRLCLTLAALSGFLAVFLGAFGAHGLKDSGYLVKTHGGEEDRDYAGEKFKASFKYLLDYETGVRYHMWHALAMGITGGIMLHRRSRLFSAAAVCFLIGIIFFSGPLYVIAVGGPRWGGIPWGAVAPLGGTSQLIGWLCLACGAFRMTSATSDAHEKR